MRNLLPLAALLFLQYTGRAQKFVYDRNPVHIGIVPRVTVADPAEDNYDVKYVKFNLVLGNLSTDLSGDVTTNAVTTVPSFTSYVFELDTLLTIDSMFINGNPVSVTSSGAVRSATVAPAMAGGTHLTAKVVYHGTPLSGLLYHSRGMNSVQDPTTFHRVTYTSSECFGSMEWWPCKQSLRDKIDSVDMWVTIPDSLKAGSNGLLKAVTTIDASHNRYEWHESYPIDYYLVSLAIAPYTDYSYYMHFSGSSDSMLVQDFVYSDSSVLAGSRTNIDSLDTIINYFSGLYGRYPFWHEKMGHCMAPIGGGMENQTMATVLEFNLDLLTHELGHQWFGDNVTCGSWADIIMNEGFANYTQYLYDDHFVSSTSATTSMAYMQSDVKAVDTGTCYVNDTTNEARIFDGRLSYEKGCCVIHMLRSVINSDSLFFTLLRTYQATLAGSTGTISDFKNVAVGLFGASINGVSFDTFFNQWAYLEGYPKITTTWNQAGTDIFIRLDQVGAVPSSVPFFTLPVELHLHATTGDTVVRMNVNRPSQFFHFTWSHPIMSAGLDPNRWLIYKSEGYFHDPSLNTELVIVPIVTATPNPATDDWQVNNVPAGSALQLTDAAGNILWSGACIKTQPVIVPGGRLAAGLYILNISSKGTRTTSFKLIKL